jgi:hypothetical protein
MAYLLKTFPLLLVTHGVTTLRNMAGYAAILHYAIRLTPVRH